MQSSKARVEEEDDDSANKPPEIRVPRMFSSRGSQSAAMQNKTEILGSVDEDTGDKPSQLNNVRDLTKTRERRVEEDDDGEFSEGEQKKACAHFFLNSFTDKPEETSMTFVSELCCIVRTVIFILLSINRHKRPFPPKKRESFCCEEKTS